MNAVRNVSAIVEKEWRHYFGSPIAYVALFVWTLLFGGFFYLLFKRFSLISLQGGQMEMGGAPKMSLNEWVFAGVLHNMAVVALFLTPMITMRLFAEEKRQGTFELLATNPITNLEIVLGKFFAALGLYAIMIVTGFLNFALIWYYATVKPEWKPLLTGALALLLIGASFIAVGLFVSTLTKNQIVAGTVTFGVLLGCWLLGWMDDPSAGVVARAVSYVGLVNHIDDLIRGVIDLKDVVFYVAFVTFGLFLAHQSVESQRWRA
ncbi:MAG TPA: ABC transporter permease [Vicinamibacteria bacterium]|nr:ABC transporter permease [Vicinamibacteria bacterium]